MKEISVHVAEQTSGLAPTERVILDASVLQELIREIESLEKELFALGKRGAGFVESACENA